MAEVENTYTTTLPVIRAQLVYDMLHDGDFAIYHHETEVDQIVDFDDRVYGAVNEKLATVNFVQSLQLPTVDSGLANSLWLDTES